MTAVFPRALTVRFTPVALVGRGSMGHVFHVRPVADAARDLALKLLLPHVADGLNRERFAREARAMAQLDHPRIVRYAGSDFSGRIPWLAMDLLSGTTLSSRLREGPMGEGEVHAMTLGVLEGLAHLHAKGILHRDLKPSNVFLDRSRGPVLIDFGLARRVDAATVLTGKGMVMGSLAYLAPELLGDASHNARTDVFGVGAIAYEALVGAGLHDAGGRESGAAEVTASLMGGAYYSVVRRALPSRLSPLGKAILRALAPDPRDRFASASEMAAALA